MQTARLWPAQQPDLPIILLSKSPDIDNYPALIASLTVSRLPNSYTASSARRCAHAWRPRRRAHLANPSNVTWFRLGNARGSGLNRLLNGLTAKSVGSVDSSLLQENKRRWIQSGRPMDGVCLTSVKDFTMKKLSIIDQRICQLLQFSCPNIPGRKWKYWIIFWMWFWLLYIDFLINTYKERLPILKSQGFYYKGRDSLLVRI